MIGTPKKTFQILKKYNFKFKKSFGQNFLIDNNILNRIVDGAQIDENTMVIEIGPGIGSLTEALAKKAKKVISFEIDTRLLPILEETLIDYNNIKIINEDILKVDVDAFIKSELADCDKVMVVANLPYYITTPILTHLLENTTLIDGYVVMMQKEVANRLNAKVGTKDYNSLTILLNYYTDVEYLFTVPKKVFVPAPNVESAVVRILTKKKKEFNVNEEKFFKFVRSCFSQRRKTLMNNLITFIGKDKKELLMNICLEVNIDPTRRSETLTINEFNNLHKKLLDSNIIN
ncbi:16S rRNA (adenine(1518)-N(6)/adenine(1519)-N(6))-dimethyltransferase RsmA [Gemella sp. GH3]|uniref:16S rRNA (adenine(1518)-N(6)/adenine(1519)-N(6))- dimethyltransferase RsmA n=1 Tax=unclassified Gemella TaxID=2624949 RepID=UPI0015D05704|nr:MULTISPECIES: 16S rRNA (adenine(1518)-N(6)/adenine(1519)-N(6))-dimethyltransferase RsmA [unclassified Gemella]MBF0713272.1 16S rRNA (adenine(1518)-N(6)/adenine(1519)-N(6))-dimethyltransferase RsmA [Gemella sp. GH3.1]NYS50224.1 16S rRNA (adenine(1518)-N(6)/adenine(1519)-N(6))-dimethyltransferase RsmA [Gemella sp. GH3]